MATTRRIGLLCPRYFKVYAHEILDGMVDFAAAHPEYQFLDYRFNRLSEAIARLGAGQPDALLLGLDRDDYRQVESHLPRRIPLINAHPDLLAPAIPTVCVDQEALAIRLFDYFAGLTLRHVGLVGSGGSDAQEHFVTAISRLAKERSGSCSSFALTIDQQLYETGSVDPLPALEDWLRGLPRPAGIITSGGYSALLVSRSAGRLQLAIPDDLAIVSRSDDEVALFASPPITSVRSVGRFLGHKAMQVMDATFAGAPHPRGRISLPVPPIIERRSTGFPAGIDEGFSRALRFIRHHACEGIKVKDVLREVRGMSRTRLYEQCRRFLGRSPADEAMHVRLNTARHLLAYEDLSVSRIAERCGFSSQSQFSTAFRRETGIAPSAWRKSCRTSISRGSAAGRQR